MQFKYISEMCYAFVQVAVTESGIVCCHGWLPYDKNISGFYTFDRDLSMNNIKFVVCIRSCLSLL